MVDPPLAFSVSMVAALRTAWSPLRVELVVDLLSPGRSADVSVAAFFF